MRNYITDGLKIALLTIPLLLMIGCGSSNTYRPSKDFKKTTRALDSLLQQADQSPPDKKNPLLVKASRILLVNGRVGKALELLIHIDNRYLNDKEKNRYHLLYAEALIATTSSNIENPAETKELEERKKASLTHLLNVTTPTKHSKEWQVRYFKTLSDSYLANHNYFESARQRIEITDLIKKQNQISENNEKIWHALSQIEADFLSQLLSDFNTKSVNGWLELVQINQRWGEQPDRLLKYMAIWKRNYPRHPAMIVRPKPLQRVAHAEVIHPKKIAVLLPLSGRVSSSGKMVHDGIIAAHYQIKMSESSPTIHFYDTNQSLSGSNSYDQAIADGADFVIGPLLKPNIDEIIVRDSLPTPVLFLNTASHNQNRHPHVYQFDLSIEDEVIQAAHRAWENGYRKAIAFVPDDKRGLRAEKAFKKYFEKLGGELIDTQTYKDIKRLKDDVQNLLGVNKSINRKKQLERIVGRNIEFKMRRRQDADFIFMLSQPEKARRIKPFIDFYFGLDLPVISTKRVYSGRHAPHLDNDLNGIEFSGIPLYISQQSKILHTKKTLKAINPNILKNGNGQLFSLGFDAYEIISQVSKLRAFPGYRWYGLSGEIGIDEAGLVHRYLTWAKFEKGIPVITKERLPPVFINTRIPISETSTPLKRKAVVTNNQLFTDLQISTERNR